MHHCPDFMDYARGQGAFADDNGVIAIARLIEGLFHSEPRVRKKAGEALGMVGEHQALHDCLSKNAEPLLTGAARALDDTGDH